MRALARGEIPYYERNLAEMVCRNVRAGRLVCVNDLETFAGRANVIFLAQDPNITWKSLPCGSAS